jgi:hypothetical protein
MSNDMPKPPDGSGRTGPAGWTPTKEWLGTVRAVHLSVNLMCDDDAGREAITAAANQLQAQGWEVTIENHHRHYPEPVS